jgi:hypothetical protein
MAKKKKKKQRKGGQRPTYAKGKPVEPSGKKKAAAGPAKKAAAAPAAKTSAKGAGSGGKAAPERVQWNLIRGDSLERKVFMTLLYVIVVATLLSYPLRLAQAQRSYDEAKKDLKKWEQKYPTKAEQKKHEKTKPVLPPKPTLGIMLLELFMGAVQGVLFAFLGLNVSRRTDLTTPLLDKLHTEGFDPGDLKGLLMYALPAAVLLLIPLVGKDVFVDHFFPAPRGGSVKYPVWKYALSSINDAVQFQLLFVFLVFSALVWLFFRYREQVRVDPHWPAMAVGFLVAMGFIYLNMFGGGGVSGVSVTGGKMLVFAALFSLPVLILAYLYWKKGLEYSLLAGVVGFGVYPFLATLFIK